MANCNCNDFPISCAPHAPGGDCCHHPHGCPPHPCPPPDYKGGTSMYIGARYVPIFADPVEWDDEREYEPLTIVTYNGNCYTSKCYVPKGAQLPPYPEGQTKYWVKTSDYNYQFADLKKTVTDLSRLVEQFQKDNERFTELINGWNAQVQQWEQEMTAWGERLDTVESNVSDLTDLLNAEIARAKAAEQTNAAAITEETALREAGDTANKNLIEQEQNRAEGEETAIREEFAAADTALSNRITINKTDIDAIKAEQAIQNTNISNNAKNISDDSAEIAKHAARLTSLESNASDWDTIFPDTTIAQEVQKEELARANGDTALNGRCDTIAADVEEVRDIANHKVDTTTYTEGQTAQDARITAAQNAANKANTNIGNWETDHPGQTISECATSIENELAAVDAKADANAANIGDWNTEHPGTTVSQEVTNVNNSIPDVSGFVTKTAYDAGQKAQDDQIKVLQPYTFYVDFPAGTVTNPSGHIGIRYPVIIPDYIPCVSETGHINFDDFTVVAFAFGSQAFTVYEEPGQCGTVSGITDATLRLGIGSPAVLDTFPREVALALTTIGANLDKTSLPFKVRITYAPHT